MAAEWSFDLSELFRRVDRARVESGLSWAALASHVGVAASTIRRFDGAADAEADGVLALVGWLGTDPEAFVADCQQGGERLAPTNGGYIRVDMSLVAAVTGARRVTGRTTIQRLVEAAQTSGRPIASFTRACAE